MFKIYKVTYNLHKIQINLKIVMIKKQFYNKNMSKQ